MRLIDYALIRVYLIWFKSSFELFEKKNIYINYNIKNKYVIQLFVLSLNS